MQIEIVVNGKKVMATIDDKDMKEALGEETKKKKTGYERAEKGEKFYIPSINRCDDFCGDVEHKSSVDDMIYRVAKYYTDKNVARNNERADTLMRKLRRFSAENGGMPSCRMAARSSFKYDWSIEFDIDRGSLYAINTYTRPGIIYFSSRKAAEKAIEEFKDELLWYFTEYDPMPEGFWDD